MRNSKTQHSIQLFTLMADRYREICNMSKAYRHDQLKRSNLRRAHFMRIQHELYRSYLEAIYEHRDRFKLLVKGVKITEQSMRSYLPENLLKKMKVNFKKMSYYKAGKHNTMTEDFVMALPRKLS